MSRTIFRNPKAAQIGPRIAQVLRDRGLTQTAFAQKIGVKPGHVSDWIRGRHAPSSATLLLICREFGLNEKWLTEGTGLIYKEDMTREEPVPYGFKLPPGIPNDIPVLGQGKGGRGQFSVDGYPVGQGQKRVRRPFDVRDPQAFAVEVKGSSMAPRYEEGDTVICSPAKGWKTGDYCVVIKENDEVLIKKVRDLGDRILLTSINPTAKDIELTKSEIRSIHKIVWKKEK